MPPKGKFAPEHLHVFAHKATLSNPNATCVYRPEHLGHVSKRSIVSFEWHIQTADFEDRQIVDVRVDSASRRGVPYPESWRVALR